MDRRLLAFMILGSYGALAQFPNWWFGYENIRWSECTNLFSTCTPTISSCADYLCNQCLSFGGSGFKSCCQQATPNVCFQTAKNGGAQITAAPSTITDPQQLACQTANAIILSCESATSNFTSLDDSSAASCLCYSNTAWQPASFDQPFSSCLAWASSADTSDYSDLSSLRGFCSSVGDVVNSPATITAESSGTGSVQTSTGFSTPTATASKSEAGMLELRMAIPKLLAALAITIVVGCDRF